jgi:hypothetical protein
MVSEWRGWRTGFYLGLDGPRHSFSSAWRTDGLCITRSILRSWGVKNAKDLVSGCGTVLCGVGGPVSRAGLAEVADGCAVGVGQRR